MLNLLSISNAHRSFRTKTQNIKLAVKRLKESINTIWCHSQVKAATSRARLQKSKKKISSWINSQPLGTQFFESVVGEVDQFEETKVDIEEIEDDQRTFKRFQELPAELRSKIWQTAAYNTRQVVSLYPEFVNHTGRNRDWMLTGDHIWHVAAPAFFLVNVEARQESMKCYDMLGGDPDGHTKAIPFSFERDVFFFDRCTNFTNVLKSLAPSQWLRLQHIAFQTNWEFYPPRLNVIEQLPKLKTIHFTQCDTQAFADEVDEISREVTLSWSSETSRELLGHNEAGSIDYEGSDWAAEGPYLLKLQFECAKNQLLSSFAIKLRKWEPIAHDPDFFYNAW